MQVGGADDRSDRSDPARREAGIDLSDRDQQVLFYRATAAGGGGLDIATACAGRFGGSKMDMTVQAVVVLRGLRQRGMQVASGADAEFGEDLAQVPFDRPPGQE